MLNGNNPDESVMLHTFHALPAQEGEAGLIARWETIRAVRGEVSKAVEAVRTEGKIGASLQAEVEIRAGSDKFDALASLGDDLKFVLITSAAQVVPAANETDEKVIVNPSKYRKCERCWHYRSDVGADAGHPGLCGRCVSNLFGRGEDD